MVMKHQMTGSQRMTALYSKRGMKSRTKTVSYTHLDVYKRQIPLNVKALCPAHRRAALALFWFSFGAQKRT